MRRSQLHSGEPGALPFLWATGIEDTFITEPWPATGRTLDEYELTGHYDCWRDDIDLVARLGVRAARYGIPWHRVQPQPGAWDWQWADGPLARLLDLGIDPIVDLVHYGTPSWIDGAFAHPDYPRFVAEYARRLAERFKDRIFAYTPLNEPRITAWYCGRLGWWPPHLRGSRGFLAVMLGVCRGIVETVRALRDVDPEITIVHVDATDLYTASEEALGAEAARRQEVVFLALDLIAGRLTEDHPLWRWCVTAGGASPRDLEWFASNPISIDICGINLYPMFSQKVLRRDPAGRARIRMTYADGRIIDRLARMYYDRYRLPVMVTETAARGSVERRMAWLNECAAAIDRCRAEGLPLIGFTWWPMFALVAWAFRQGTRPPAAYLEQFGLYDLIRRGKETDEYLERVETPLVAAYRRLVEAGSEAFGPLPMRSTTQQRAG